MTPVKLLVNEAMESIEEMHNFKNLRRVLTGFKDLDRITWGFEPGSINLITSYNNGGKIALASNICKNNAFSKRHNIGVGIVAPHERAKTICRQFIIQEADQSEQDIVAGALNTANWTNIMNGVRLLGESGLTFFELSEQDSIQDLVPLLKEAQIKLLLFDTSPINYFHLSEKITIRRQMKKIKEIATACDIAVLLLGEMSINSSREKRPYPPQLKDIVAIDSLLSFLTTVIIIDQESDSQPVKPWLESDHSKELVNAMVAYNDGEVGRCSLHYQPALKKFSDYTGIDEDDIPE